MRSDAVLDTEATSETLARLLPGTRWFLMPRVCFYRDRRGKNYFGVGDTPHIEE